MGFDVRAMTRAELDMALRWAIDEGWNPGLYDAEPFYVVDPKGFFIGELDSQPIGSLSAVAYDATFGFIGLYIVLSKHRGQGYSVELWDTGMLYLGARNVGLACPNAQENYYQECGFSLGFRSMRYETVGGGVKPRGVVELGGVPLEELVEYDARLFSVPRPKFLTAWVSQPETTALGLISKGKLTGYGVLRRCHVGYKIGPLMADTQRGAETLLRALLAAAPGESIFIDVPENNPAALALAQRHHLRPLLQTAWMYTKAAPDVNTKKIYGMTTRGLG
jgi:hypothetical protein